MHATDREKRRDLLAGCQPLCPRPYWRECRRDRQRRAAQAATRQLRRPLKCRLIVLQKARATLRSTLATQRSTLATQRSFHAPPVLRAQHRHLQHSWCIVTRMRRAAAQVAEVAAA